MTAYTNGWYRPDRDLFETLAECPEVARTYRQSRRRDTSAMAPGSDIPAAMSGFRLIPSGLHSGPDVAGATGIRRVLTRRRHSAPRSTRSIRVHAANENHPCPG